MTCQINTVSASTEGPRQRGRPRQRPKGKAKAVMKRPSSKALEFEVPKPTAADLEKKVNVYASRVWHAARLLKFCKASGPEGSTAVPHSQRAVNSLWFFMLVLA